MVDNNECGISGVAGPLWWLYNGGPVEVSTAGGWVRGTCVHHTSSDALVRLDGEDRADRWHRDQLRPVPEPATALVRIGDGRIDLFTSSNQIAVAAVVVATRHALVARRFHAGAADLHHGRIRISIQLPDRDAQEAQPGSQLLAIRGMAWRGALETQLAASFRQLPGVGAHMEVAP